MPVNLDKKGGVARITIDWPPVNVLDIATMKELNTRLESIKGDPDVNIRQIVHSCPMDEYGLLDSLDNRMRPKDQEAIPRH